MKWYPWLRPAYETLSGQYLAGRGHPALLLGALPGMGEDALCYALARLLMCQSPLGSKSCGQCRGCQLMQAGTHPDYYTAEPEKGKQNLGIDAVRDITTRLYTHARQGGAKLVWIKDAGLLTEAAASALLKTLEEPPEDTWFILTTHAPEKLLPTLRSRCFFFSLATPEEHWAQTWLQRESSCEAQLCLAALRLSSGAPAAALSLLEPARCDARQSLYQHVASAFGSGDLYSLLPVLNTEQAAERLWWLASLLLDALKWQQRATQSVANVDAPALIEQLATLPPAVLQFMLRTLFQAREQLLSVPGLNRELLLAEQLLAWEQNLQSGTPLTTIHL